MPTVQPKRPIQLTNSCTKSLATFYLSVPHHSVFTNLSHRLICTAQSGPQTAINCHAIVTSPTCARTCNLGFSNTAFGMSGSGKTWQLAGSATTRGGSNEQQEGTVQLHSIRGFPERRADAAANTLIPHDTTNNPCTHVSVNRRLSPLRSEVVTLLKHSVLPFPDPIQSYRHDYFC